MADDLIDIEREQREVLLRLASEYIVALRSGDPTIDVGATTAALSQNLLRYSSVAGRDENRYYHDSIHLADQAIKEAEERRRHQGLPGYSTGYSRLDAGIGGFERQNIYLLNSKTGSGKTTFALQTALHVANSETPVLFVSPEARSDMLGRRAISLLSGVPGWAIRRGHIDDNQMHLLHEASKTIKKIPIVIYDLPVVTIHHIETTINRFCQQIGTSPGLLVIDYLQQMSGEDDFQTVTANMKAIETLTVTQNVATLLMSQVGRSSGDGSAKEASKGSGKAEELSSVVMGLVPIPKKKRKDGSEEDYADPMDLYRRHLVVSKNRNEGDTFRFLLEFERSSGRLKEIG